MDTGQQHPFRGDPADPALRAAVREHALFRDFGDADLDTLFAAGTLRDHDAGVVLFREGDPGDELVVLLRGAVRVTRARTDDEPLEIARLEAVEVVGEMALLDEGPRSATVTTDTAVTLLALGRKRWRALVDERSEMAARLLMAIGGLLAGRIRDVDQDIEAIIASQRGADGAGDAAEAGSRLTGLLRRFGIVR